MQDHYEPCFKLVYITLKGLQFPSKKTFFIIFHSSPGRREHQVRRVPPGPGGRRDRLLAGGAADLLRGDDGERGGRVRPRIQRLRCPDRRRIRLLLHGGVHRRDGALPHRAQGQRGDGLAVPRRHRRGGRRAPSNFPIFIFYNIFIIYFSNKKTAWFDVRDLAAGDSVTVHTQDNTDEEDMLYYGHSPINFYGHILNE